MQDDFLISIFCLVDDFFKDFDPMWKRYLLPDGSSKEDMRNKRSPSLIYSEVMTIAIYFHLSKIRTFKDYYIGFILGRFRKYFPKAPSYSRFVSFGNMPGNFFRQFHYFDSLSCQKNFLSSSIQKNGQTGQNIDRMVFWFQTTFDYQCEWGNIGLHADCWKCG